MGPPAAASKRLVPRKEKHGLESGEIRLELGDPAVAAAGLLGLRQVTALVSPDEDLAFRILAPNTEKAHNLKDRSLEVIVLARINPVRFHRPKKGETGPAMAIGPALTRMSAAARRFDPGSVRERDLALVAAVSGGPGE